jgi:hypothetical protein
MSAESDDIEPDEISERVVRDPSRTDQKILRGFALGRSTSDDQWRLYLNAELTHYLEFDKRATLHAKEVRPGETVVWIQPDTQVRETSTRNIPVEFLRGEIQRGFLRGVSGINRIMALSSEYPGCEASGCGCGTQECTKPGPGPGGDTVGLSCGC